VNALFRLCSWLAKRRHFVIAVRDMFEYRARNSEIYIPDLVPPIRFNGLCVPIEWLSLLAVVLPDSPSGLGPRSQAIFPPLLSLS
jgi:hypothetical protein